MLLEHTRRWKIESVMEGMLLNKCFFLWFDWGLITWLQRTGTYLLFKIIISGYIFIAT